MENDLECIYIFNTEMELQGIIDSFISLRWRRKYFEAGEFEIVIAPDPNNIDLIKSDNIVVRNNSIEAGIIENININDDGTQIEITISGRFLSAILERRIVKKRINFTGSVIEGMKKLLNQMTKLSNILEIEPTTIPSEKITFQCTYKNVYEYLIKLSKYSNIAFRIVPDIENKKMIFQNYVGVDRTNKQMENEQYQFSDTAFNIEKSEYDYSNKNECNYVLIGGQGEAEERVLTEISLGKSCMELRERFVDARNESPNDLTDSEYREILKSLGREQLNEETKTLEVTADTIDYKDKWDLGDIVDVWISEWKISQEFRITEVEEIVEEGQRTVYATFGDTLSEPFENDEE